MKIKYYVVLSIYGRKAVEVGYKFQGNYCYRGICFINLENRYIFEFDFCILSGYNIDIARHKQTEKRLRQ